MDEIYQQDKKEIMSIVITNLSKQIDPKLTKSVSRIYRKDGHLYGEKRCRICGQWITWVDIEPQECWQATVVHRTKGRNSECEDWAHIRKGAREERFKQKNEQMEKIRAERGFSQFMNLLRKKII